MKNVTTALTAAFLTLAPSAFAADTATEVEAKATEVKNDIKTKFFQLVDKETIKVGFDQGKAKLTDGEKSDLKALVESLKADGTVKSYVVAAWSDKDFPADSKAKLSAADRDLAAKRQAAVVSALKHLGVKTVEAHSMAEHPTWVAKVFGTNDAVVKGAKSADGDAQQKAGEKLADEIKAKGGPGTVVVIAKRMM